MLKYLYYVWNLLKKDERLKLFEYLGMVVISALLLTVVDWQYCILFKILLERGTGTIFQTIVATQLVAWVTNLWYYYIKYRILLMSNSFGQTISNRHYDYTLSRISKNAPYEWIGQKSIPELAQQLDSSDQSLNTVFVFINRTVKSLASIAFNLLIVFISYRGTLIFLLPTLIIAYTVIANHDTVLHLNTVRGDFKTTRQTNYLVISDNLMTLFDEVVSGNYLTTIKNILSLNTEIKGKQNTVVSSEDQMYTRLSLTLLSGYLVMVIFSFISPAESMESLCLFIMTIFLSYRSMNTHLNNLCDAYYDYRRTEFELDALEDVWVNTAETRPSAEQKRLPCYAILTGRLLDYHRKIYLRIDRELLDIYRSFIVDHALAAAYRKFKNTYYGTDELDDLVKLEVYRRYIGQSAYEKKFRKHYVEELESLDLPTVDEVYEEFYDDQLVISDSRFSFSITQICYEYSSGDQLKPFRLIFEESEPLQLLSSTHLLIKGASGAGKSTLLKVIRGIIPLAEYETGKGGIRMTYLDDELDDPLDTTWLPFTTSIGYCGQNVVSFISGNVAQVMSGDFTTKTFAADDQALMKLALRAAEVDVIFHTLTFQLKSTTISGGQKQRLTVAKQIYRFLKNNYKIVIFDEIDAGLDVATAQRVLYNLRILFADRMMVVVLHTPQLHELFEKAVLVTDGRITHG